VSAPFDKVKGTQLESIGVYPRYVPGKVAPTTLGAYQDELDMPTLKVQRGAVYTWITIEANTGKVIKINVPTATYLVNTAADENALLKLAGQDITPLDMGALSSLGETEALRAVNVWLKEIITGMDTLLKGLKDDMLAVLPSATIAEYNTLVAKQNAEWQAVYPSVTTSVPPTPLAETATSAGSPTTAAEAGAIVNTSTADDAARGTTA
jgi:hypothetical protein